MPRLHRLLHATANRNLKHGARARSFASIDYRVPGLVSPIRQSSSMRCWATVTGILVAWKEQASRDVRDVIAVYGQPYLGYYDSNSALPATENTAFFTHAGMILEPPQCFSIEGWQSLLRAYGPLILWIHPPGNPVNLMHLVVMVGMSGDGTPDGTRFQIVDPNSGREVTLSVEQLVQSFHEVLGPFPDNAPISALIWQVVHWPANAQKFRACAIPARQPSAFEWCACLHHRARLGCPRLGGFPQPRPRNLRESRVRPEPLNGRDRLRNRRVVQRFRAQPSQRGHWPYPIHARYRARTWHHHRSTRRPDRRSVGLESAGLERRHEPSPKNARHGTVRKKHQIKKTTVNGRPREGNQTSSSDTLLNGQRSTVRCRETSVLHRRCLSPDKFRNSRGVRWFWDYQTPLPFAERYCADAEHLRGFRLLQM